jgi:hypothetical protein
MQGSKEGPPRETASRSTAARVPAAKKSTKKAARKAQQQQQQQQPQHRFMPEAAMTEKQEWDLHRMLMIFERQSGHFEVFGELPSVMWRLLDWLQVVPVGSLDSCVRREVLLELLEPATANPMTPQTPYARELAAEVRRPACCPSAHMPEAPAPSVD